MLPHYLAAPTIVTLDGVPRLADRLRLGDFALLLQAASDASGRNFDDEETVRFDDPDVEAWMQGDGVPVVVWCSLRRRWPDLTLADAYDLTTRLTESEKLILRYSALRRGKLKEAAPGEGVDLALQKWGRVIRWFADNGKGLPPHVAEYTLDQADLLLAEHDPEAKREAAEHAEGWANLRAMYEAAIAKQAEDAAPREVTLADLGYAVVPGQEQETPGEAKGDEHGDDGRWDDDGGRAAGELPGDGSAEGSS